MPKHRSGKHVLSAGLLQVGISLFPRLQSGTLSRFTRGLAFYSCEMAISIPMGAMWCSRSNPWPSQTWCHLPNDPKKEKLETKTLNIKENISMDALWCSRRNRWPSELSTVPYSPQGFPYSRGFLRNIPFLKALSSYVEEI